METKVLCQTIDELCETCCEEHQEVARDVLSRVAGKWPLWVLHVVAANGGPMRFSRVMEQVEGVSQKVLTQTLRQLERDGLLSRKVYPQVPPRVDYNLTPLGKELLEQVLPLWQWVAGRAADFAAARERFAGRTVESSTEPASVSA